MDKPKRKVCLITPSHIASNPRLVKEASALDQAGYHVHLIFTQNLNRLAKIDRHILEQNPCWTYDMLFLSPKKPAYKLSALKQKLAGFIASFSNKWQPAAINRHFHWQLSRALNTQADLFIAHNLAALPVAQLAAQKTGAKWGFDAEDFHRHEERNNLADRDVKRKISIEERFMPSADYLTAASPMIAKAYSQILHKPVLSVLNVFERTGQYPALTNAQKPLRIFWFSQTIGPGRGIEIAIRAIGQIKSFRVELHLLGEVSSGYKTSLLHLSRAFQAMEHVLVFHRSVEQDELMHITAGFDMGLAGEINHNLNKSYCLSNKIFTYLQCGLALLVSDTPAQADFMQENPQTGKLYEQNNPASLAEAIVFLASNRGRLNDIKLANYQLSEEKYNWEIESQKFLEVVKTTLG